jgi:hypothetical protein
LPPKLGVAVQVRPVDAHRTRVIAEWSGYFISPLINAVEVIKERQRRLIVPFTVIVKTHPDDDALIVKLYHFVEGETGQLDSVSFSFHGMLCCSFRLGCDLRGLKKSEPASRPGIRQPGDEAMGHWLVGQKSAVFRVVDFAGFGWCGNSRTSIADPVQVVMVVVRAYKHQHHQPQHHWCGNSHLISALRT